MAHYKRECKWEPGAALITCASCGFPFRFPGELHYADNKKFYCLRACWDGKTHEQDQREQAAARQRPADTIAAPIPGGKPTWR